ncbi:thiamine kinase [Candidatus Pantoea deserta]|uniref:thiamine kinase n=1 Tax=Candidatus Pantoea deserta TaxID=1869313 RepID=UPI001F296BC0|nr:thiamine kinase [Pantoea deserta]
MTASSLLPLPGLTGQSSKLLHGQEAFIVRRAPPQPIPFIDRQREARLLRKLSARGVAPRPLTGDAQLLILPWQEGEPLSSQAFQQRSEEVVALLLRLHRQPLTGYALHLLPLLERYWQLCQQRDLRWQRALRQLQRTGEPRPLRLAPLHMDVHSGNLIASQQGLHLIDWEYAADGDVALELAALCAAAPEQAEGWLESYAQAARLCPARLARQVARWQPWLRLLMASWYQLRAEQSADAQLRQLARQSWQHL